MYSDYIYGLYILLGIGNYVLEKPHTLDMLNETEMEEVLPESNS